MPITLELKEGITFILGVNNIGKSNLLKFFYEFRSVMQGEGAFVGHNSTANIPDSKLYSALKNQKSTGESILIKIETDNQILNFTITPISSSLESGQYRFLHGEINNKTGKIFERGDYKMFFELFKNSMYVGSFRTPSFISNAPYFDISIGQSFINDWDNWANGNDLGKRNKIRTLKNELKELFEFDFFEIAVTQDKKNLIVETDDGTFNLDELGGGIGHFILVLGNALIKEPSFILIDEPENALHPKLQEVFIRTLASKAKYGVIATSHSIGLARSTADKIYSLTKNSEGTLKLVDFGESYTPSVMSNINELGFSQFVELGGSNILLVEGRTDIKCFKEILRKYNIEHHFIVMDLGGANMINEKSHEELDELKRLNAKSYNVIFDSEIESEGQSLKTDFAKFKAMCEDLGFKVFPTEVHSTDNYITQAAIDSTTNSGYTKLEKHESLKSRTPDNKWGKSLNWKMFREMAKEDFEGTELDSFIKDVLIPLTT